MFESVSKFHPDKIADRIAGALVDLAYKKEKDPRVAVEVLIGHGKCHIINETSVKLKLDDVKAAVKRISGIEDVDYLEVPQDKHLSDNQKDGLRCGDNGIFKGVESSIEECQLAYFTKVMDDKYGCDGKYIIDRDTLTVCQSNIKTRKSLTEDRTEDGTEDEQFIIKTIQDVSRDIHFFNINPIGDWTGGTDVDTGATNRKLGSQMGRAATGGGLCLSGDTEFLSNDLKWHRIDEWKEGQKVAQWNNGQLEFVVPTAYIHNPKEKLYHIYNNSKLSMCLTPYHEMLLLTSKNNLIKKQAKDIVPNLINGSGNAGKIMHSFVYEGHSQDIVLSFYDSLLQVAFCADGTILGDSNKTWRGRIRVKKQYKKTRLRYLFEQANRGYKETQDGEYSIFWFIPPLENKSLYECFKNSNKDVWAAISDEVYRWDGDAKRKLFRTTKKEDADFVQFLIAVFGGCSTIQYYPKKNYYVVHELKSTTTELRKTKTTPIKVIETEGESYCFNVPSHNLIVRHNDKIFITGNCGKDLSKADVSVNIYAHLKANRVHHDVELSCAIGDKYIDGLPYSAIVEIARDYIFNHCGGFEKFAEYGLIR